MQSTPSSSSTPPAPDSARISRNSRNNVYAWPAQPRYGPPVVRSAPRPYSLDISSRFGERVRALRLARNLTQTGMAVRFGIDRTFISDLERGRKSISLPTLEILALGFKVSLSDLFRGL